jgi:uncharacterized repeat protein (TIGR03803 family)
LSIHAFANTVALLEGALFLASPPLSNNGDTMRIAFPAPRSITAIFSSAAASWLFVTPAAATTFTVLHKFCSQTNCLDGGNPLQSPLVPDGAGNFLGTAQNDGANTGGVLYEMIGGTKYKKLFDFPASGAPRGPLVRDTNGNLYGIEGTGNRGFGGIFKLKPNARGTKWTYETIYTFCQTSGCPDGSTPLELTYVGAATGTPYDGQAPLYGSTGSGGAQNDGVVFQLRQRKGAWHQTVLYSFCSAANCADGMWPSYGLIADAAGTLYGTTVAGGGSAGQGVVFRLTPGGRKSWSESVLYAFCNDAQCSDGGQPSGLVADSGGNLYGTTGVGGDATGGFSGGVLYRLAPAGGTYQYTRLYSFCQQPDCADGDEPMSSLVVGPTGTLYGTTAGDSRVFSFVPQTSAYTVLHAFCMDGGKCRDGFFLDSPLTLDSSGQLLGNTAFGGNDSSTGTVFKVVP